MMFYISLPSIRQENYGRLYLHRDFQFPSIYEVEEIAVRLNAYVNNEKIRSWSSIEINS